MLKSLQGRLTLLFVAFVLLVVVSISAMMWGSETQRQDGLLINLAGRQRMLAQQMARLAFEAGEGQDIPNAALQEAEQTFDQTLGALRDGGEAPYLSDATATLPFTRDLAIRSALDEAGLIWGDFRVLLDQLQQTPRDDPSFAAALQSVEEKSSALVARADAVVRLYEADAIAKVNRLRAMQVVFLVGALILLGVGAWITRKSALEPLQELTRAANRLSGNDLDTAVRVEGPEEMRALSTSFDSMRRSLRTSRSELLELMSTLEARVAQRTRELDALNEVSREIASQLDVRHVLNSVTEKARLLLDGDSAMLCLLDEAGQHLILKSASGDSSIETTDRMSTVNQASAALASPRALICSNEKCMGGCGLANPHALSHVVAPLRIGDNVIGALCVSSSRANHFSKESADAATKLANTAAVALQNAQLYAQAEKVAALEERNRIAADIHDGLGQTLSYLGLVTDQTTELIADGQDEKAIAHLERARGTINEATRQVRASIQHLLDPAPRERKLCDLLKETASEFEEKYRVEIHCRADENVSAAIPRETVEQVMNVTREALENACKHAGAHSIRIHLGRENGYCFVRVEDDGRGFDPASPRTDSHGHFGLRVMQARAEHIGGNLRVESAPEAGSRVTLMFPNGEKV